METIKIALSTSLRQFLRFRSSTAGYTSTDEYLAALIRADQMRQSVRELDAMIRASVGYGPEGLQGDDRWQQLRDEFRKRHRVTTHPVTGRVMSLDHRRRRRAPPAQTV